MTIIPIKNLHQNRLIPTCAIKTMRHNFIQHIYINALFSYPNQFLKPIINWTMVLLRWHYAIFKLYYFNILKLLGFIRPCITQL